ncbi:hydrogenase expression/formation protein HypE [Helicobacter sp. T3_23-1056]
MQKYPHLTIPLSAGSGGADSDELINKIFLPHLGRFFVSEGEDAGVFGVGDLGRQGGRCGGKDSDENGVDFALSTDSFVISPIFFSGGDIGKLSVCGSSNDVAMMGAKPEFISFGFMIEEGLASSALERVVESIEREVEKMGLKILSADTKVLPKGSLDTLFINTTCVGRVLKRGISSKALQKGDKIILSAPIGAHGASIFASREGIGLQSHLQSDCAQLFPMLEPILRGDFGIHALRDATRGGLSAVLNEWANASGASIEIDEECIKIDDEVRGVCEILGLEAYMLANEGVCAMSVKSSEAEKICEILRAHTLGRHAKIIGEVTQTNDKKGANGNLTSDFAKSAMPNARVVLKNKWGSKRYMEYPQGELLPRIC